MTEQTALITGASRGIGRAIALELAGPGMRLALIYRGNQTAAEETAAACREKGAQAEIYACDVGDFAASKATADAVIARFGGVDILVNNAGITRDGLLMRMSEDDYDRVLDTNLKGAFNFIRHLTAQFVRRRSGRIVNITSVVGLTGNAGQANYAAAKAGLIGLTKSVAKELASRGITCNAVAPGFIGTEMTEAMTEESRQALKKAIPMGRIGQAEEIAKTVSFLCSEGAAYITGTVIRVDGGLAM